MAVWLADCVAVRLDDDVADALDVCVKDEVLVGLDVADALGVSVKDADDVVLGVAECEVVLD